MTQAELKQLNKESHTLYKKQLDAILAYLKDHKLVLVTDSFKTYDDEIIFSEDIENVEYQVIRIISPDDSYDQYVNCIGVELNNGRYTGGASIWYVNEDDNTLESAYIADVDKSYYENIINILTTGFDADWDSFIEEDIEDDDY